MTLSPRRCACPCGQLFTPSMAAQIYIDRRHNQRAYRARVAKAAKAAGLPSVLNLQTVSRGRGTRSGNGDSQRKRTPDMRLSYFKVRDAIANYFGDAVEDGRSFRADQILVPLLSDRQRKHLKDQAS